MRIGDWVNQWNREVGIGLVLFYFPMGNQASFISQVLRRWYTGTKDCESILNAGLKPEYYLHSTGV